MKRTFLAFPVETTVPLLHNLEKIRDELSGEKIKWVKPENMHLTIHFFGDTTDDDILLLHQHLEKFLIGLPAFELNINSAGIFPGIKRPHVLWFGLIPDGGLTEAVERVLSVLQKEGFNLPGKPFSPHLTIARMKWISDKPHLIEVLDSYKNREITKLRINRIHFYESRLTPEGPLYRVIHSYSLK